MQFRHRLVLTSVALLAIAALVPAVLKAQGHPGRQGQHTLTAVVPSIVRVIVDQQVRNADGSPLVRVVTNDPAIRALAANGWRPELVRVAGGNEVEARHAKGGGSAGGGLEPSVVRYTVVAP